MAKRFVIAAGGTGSMCVRSLIFLLACGCGNPADEYSILMVDKDQKSDALTACRDLIDSYRQLRDRMEGTRAFTMPKIELSSWDFTSEICAEYVEQTGKKADTLKTMTLSALLNPSGDSAVDALLQTFYTKDELNVNLDKGFYGHPNIGAAVFSYVQNRFLAPSAKDINGDMKVNTFMTDLRNELSLGVTYVYLFGSVFGGTGASVIPNIVDALRSINGGLPGTNWGMEHLVLGASLLMPYFRLPQCPNDSVEHATVRPKDDLFAEQTREALLYYNESGMLRRMTNLMLVGTKNLDETSEVYARGADQHQHFHLALQAAATTACRFFRDKLPGMHDLISPDGTVAPKGTLLLWKIAPSLDPAGAPLYQTLSATELGMGDEFVKMDRFFRYSIIIAYYMNAKFSIDLEQLAKEKVVAGTVKQMRNENNRPLKLQDPSKLLPSSEDTEKYYRIPVQLAGSFCRAFLNYYFDIAMSGYSWSNYHEKSSQPISIDNRTYYRYTVADQVADGAMDSAKLLKRWCDLINLGKLHAILTAPDAETVINHITLSDIMSFDYMDNCEVRPPYQLHDAAFQQNIGTVYQRNTLEALGLVKPLFGVVKRDDVNFKEVFDKLYEFC